MKRKYPFSMFVISVIINIIKLWYIIVAAAILFIIGYYFCFACMIIAIVLTAAVLIIAIAKQTAVVRTIKSDSENEKFNNLLDEMFKKTAGDTGTLSIR